MLPDRIEAKIRREPDGCWIWTSARGGRGYGYVHWNGRQQCAHRVVYEILVGPIPDGLTIDHVQARGCRSKLCVNPAHLEPVTNAENIRRAAALRTHCVHGHELDARRSNGRRFCTICVRAHQGRYSRPHGQCQSCGGPTSSKREIRCRDCRSLATSITTDLIIGMWDDDWPVESIAEAVGRTPRAIRQIVQAERSRGRAVSFRQPPRKPVPRWHLDNVVPLRPPEPPERAA